MFAGALLAMVPGAALASPVQSGPRIEALLGYDSAVFKADDARVTAHGFSYGVQAGYDALVGKGAIVGVEASYLRSAAKRCAGATDGVIDVHECLKADYSYFVGARVGAWATDSILLYVKAGYAWEHQKARIELDDAADGSFIAGDATKQTAGGVRFGGGAEVAITDAVYMKGEATYSIANKDDVKFHRVNAMVGAGYRF